MVLLFWASMNHPSLSNRPMMSCNKSGVELTNVANRTATIAQIGKSGKSEENNSNSPANAYSLTHPASDTPGRSRSAAAATALVDARDIRSVILAGYGVLLALSVALVAVV